MKHLLAACLVLSHIAAPAHAIEPTFHARLKGAALLLDSAAASRLASSLANNYSKQRFGVAPFTASGGTLERKKDRWVWQSMVGYGKGDLFASVSFSRTGSDPSVQVITLVLELSLNPLEE